MLMAPNSFPKRVRITACEITSSQSKLYAITLKLPFAILFLYLTKGNNKLVVPSQEKGHGGAHFIRVRVRARVRVWAWVSVRITVRVRLEYNYIYRGVQFIRVRVRLECNYNSTGV